MGPSCSAELSNLPVCASDGWGGAAPHLTAPHNSCFPSLCCCRHESVSAFQQLRDPLAQGGPRPLPTSLLHVVRTLLPTALSPHLGFFHGISWTSMWGLHDPSWPQEGQSPQSPPCSPSQPSPSPEHFPVLGCLCPSRSYCNPKDTSQVYA